MVTVYEKPDCVQCMMTKKKLTAMGIDYSTIDLVDDPDAMELVKSKGFLSAPVVNAGDEWWAGFRPDLLDELKSM